MSSGMQRYFYFPLVPRKTILPFFGGSKELQFRLQLCIEVKFHVGNTEIISFLSLMCPTLPRAVTNWPEYGHFDLVIKICLSDSYIFWYGERSKSTNSSLGKSLVPYASDPSSNPCRTSNLVSDYSLLLGKST